MKADYSKKRGIQSSKNQGGGEGGGGEREGEGGVMCRSSGEYSLAGDQGEGLVSKTRPVRN